MRHSLLILIAKPYKIREYQCHLCSILMISLQKCETNVSVLLAKPKIVSLLTENVRHSSEFRSRSPEKCETISEIEETKFPFRAEVTPNREAHDYVESGERPEDVCIPTSVINLYGISARFIT